MVFVLDNYDSFTYNLVQYMGELGAEIVIRRNDEITPEEIEALKPERILISPGPCTPQDAGISIALIKHFASSAIQVPILGVCLGHQAIGGGLRRQCGPRAEADAWQDQRSEARRKDHLQRCSIRDDLHALPFADRGPRGITGRTGGFSKDQRRRDHHGVTPPHFAHRRRPVSSRERADDARQADYPELPGTPGNFQGRLQSTPRQLTHLCSDSTLLKCSSGESPN